jgi:hypothetical protein
VAKEDKVVAEEDEGVADEVVGGAPGKRHFDIDIVE